MTTEEKIQAMEEIWNDLCQGPGNLSSPSWHEETLNEREKMIQKGDDQFLDWENAKKSIRDTVS